MQAHIEIYFYFIHLHAAPFTDKAIITRRNLKVEILSSLNWSGSAKC